MLAGALLLPLSLACSDGADLASVTRLTPQALQASLAAGDAVVVDVRSADSFASGHIAGALHIPVDEIAARQGELPPDKQIVTYCS